MNLLEKILGSAFYTGYIPFASGTFGSLIAILFYLIPGFENPIVHITAIAFIFAISIPIASKFEKVYGKDPGQCVIDEVVGMWISLLFIPKEFWYVLVTFLVWRFFDIIKPFPARQAEKISGGLGIVLDDVISGFFTLATMHIVILIIK